MRFVREIGEGAARDARGRALTTAGIAAEISAEPNGVVGGRSGLTELARRAQTAREAAFAEFEARWRDGETAALVQRIDDVVARVSGV